MASSIRSFIALPISPIHRRSIGQLIRKLATRWPEYRWSSSDELHVTLNFLGEVPDSKLPRLCEILRDTLSDCESFPYSFGSLGAFPKAERPRILWLGIDEGRSQMQKLHYKIADAVDELRLERDRKGYRPHVTLGRIMNKARWSDEMPDAINASEPMKLDSTDADEIVLYATHMEGEHSVHTVMDRIVLD